MGFKKGSKTSVKKGFTNVFISLISQLAKILIGFVLPGFIITAYGSEMNGFISSTNQFVVYLGLFEAGIGSATIQALYAPIVNNEKKRIQSILTASRKHYYKMGAWYLLVLIIGSLIYARFIEIDYSFLQIFCVLFLTGIGNLVHYWGFGTYLSYLHAEGKSYVVNNVSTISFAMANIGKILLINQGVSIVYVQLMQAVYYFMQFLIYNIYIRKKYQWIRKYEEPDYEAISQKNSVLVHKIATLIFHNTDVIILTFFCGFLTVSVYSLYSLVFTTTSNLISSGVTSIVYILGRLYFTDKKKYAKYHDLFETIYFFLGSAVFATVYIIVIPFMKLYTRNVTDVNYIDAWIPILFFIIQFLNISRGAANHLIQVAGDFEKTQGRAILETIINLSVSLICVRWLGVYGVLIGTIVALFYRVCDMLYYENHFILKRSFRKSFVKFLANAVISVGIILMNLQFNQYCPKNYIDLIGFAIKIALMCLCVYGGINSLIFIYDERRERL